MELYPNKSSGGIGASNVKEVKFYLKRVLGIYSLTSEKMCTVLAQIDAISSRSPHTSAFPN